MKLLQTIADVSGRKKQDVRDSKSESRLESKRFKIYIRLTGSTVNPDSVSKKLIDLFLSAVTYAFLLEILRKKTVNNFFLIFRTQNTDCSCQIGTKTCRPRRRWQNCILVW